MTQKIFFEHEKTGKKFDIVSIDREAGKVTLRGELGTEFEEPYDKERFQRLGYRLRKEA